MQIDADHNYNKDSREAVYAWFGKWFLGEDDATKFKEVPFEVERDEDLLVFHNRELPEHALDAEGLTRSWIESAEEQLAARKPTNAASLEQFRVEMGAALRRSLAISVPDLTRPNPVEGSDFTAQPFCDWWQQSTPRTVLNTQGRGRKRFSDADCPPPRGDELN